jgi:hypothetical protein
MVLFVAVVPAIRFGAARVLGAEVLEFDQTRFTPYISDTAKVLLVIYPVLTLPEVLARQTRLTDFGRRSICTCYIQLEPRRRTSCGSEGGGPNRTLPVLG